MLYMSAMIANENEIELQNTESLAQRAAHYFLAFIPFKISFNLVLFHQQLYWD